MKRHRWADKTEFPLANKSEQQCLDCGIVKVSRHEIEGGREVHWKEFYRGLDRVYGLDNKGTPACEPAEMVA